MELRNIQKEAIRETFESFNRGGTYHLLVASVAWGKTVYSSELMRISKSKYGARCLFLAHLNELVKQTVDKFGRVAPELSCGVFMGKSRSKHDITVGTRQTVEKNLEDLGKINLIIIDEAHLFCQQYQKIVDYCLARNHRLRVLGITGTPFTLQEGWIYGDGKLWPEPFYEAHIDAMIDFGYLCPYRYKLAEAMEELDGLKLSKGEFKECEVSELMVEERHMGTVKHAIEEYCATRKKIMIFCITIDHAEKLAEFLGVKCVHSKLSKLEWRKRVDDFKHGCDRILVNVSQLTVGFDAPQVDCLIIARPTMSPSLHCQIAGRGLRIAEGKKDCLIIDLVGNYLRHGLPSNPRVRRPKDKVDPKEKKEKKSKVCPVCFEVVEGNVCICGNEMTSEKDIQERNEKIRLEEVEREKLKIIRFGEKLDHVTKQGTMGSYFYVILKEKKLFKFCGSGTSKQAKERAKMESLKVGDVARIISTPKGCWIV